MEKERIINDDFISRLDLVSMHMLSEMRGYFGGNHRTKSYGSTVEFADFKEYNLGDDIRHIDWNLYSRFEKYFIKLFADERQMHLQLFLDCSASMKNDEKGNYMLKAAAGLGLLAIKSLDKVSYNLIKGNSCVNPFGIISGQDAFYNALSMLENTEFNGEIDLESAIMSSAELGTNDGLSVIISDFLYDNNFKKAVDYLLFRKREVMLIQVLSPEDIDPSYKGRMSLLDSEADFVDSDKNMKMRVNKGSLKAYKRALNDYISELNDFCTSRGVHFFSLNSSENVEKLFFNELTRVGTVK